jgi:hypothetical protein
VSERRSIWNVVALIATLGLSAVVAIVSVTRSGDEVVAPTPSPTAPGSPSPSRPATPGGLDGDGPYVIYATRTGVLAYDIASGSTVSLGKLDGTAAAQRSRQPGTGRLVAFPTVEGSVWSVTRIGMKRVGAIPARSGTSFEGSAVSSDDRRLAVAALTPQPATVTIDLRTGKATAIARKQGGQYPSEPLLPVAWSLGGGLLYEVPFCQCVEGSPGLYGLDTASGNSTLVTGTRTTVLFRFVVSASGQELFYGEGTSRRCRTGESEPCERAPFFLRRLAAGQRGAETVRRTNDSPFSPDAISADGLTLLVTRVVPAEATTRVERYDSNGERLSPIRGIPAGALPVALLPDNVVVATTLSPWTIVVVRSGRAETIVRSDALGEDIPRFLGWLR